jgi:hypothetical protein
MTTLLRPARLGLLAVGLAVGLPGAAQADFNGDYALVNWTLTDGAQGGVDLSQAPQTVTLFGGANDVAGATSYTITVPNAIVLSFDWSYINNDLYQDPLFEPAGYLVDGILFQLTDDLGAPTQSGTVTLALSAGDVFGFEVVTFDGYYGSANGTYGSSFLSVTDFAVPEPVSWPVLALGLGALAMLVIRRPAHRAL